MIKKDPLLGEDTTQDHNKVETLLLVKYIIRTLKLVLIILNLSYFLGLGWLSMCDTVKYFSEIYYRDLAADITSYVFSGFAAKYCHDEHKKYGIPLKDRAFYDIFTPHCEFFFAEKYKLMNIQEFFGDVYNFNERTDFDKGLLATYYAFTSLSTVGFGDYNPKSNIERLFCAFILLFGVSIFSYIMGCFIEILT